jgi:hypothetical protein
MYSLRQNIVDQIFIEVKKLYFDHSKRAATVASLQQHALAGTFPADLNFKMHEYKLPTTIRPERAEAFQKAYSDAAVTYKKTLFDARLAFLSEDLDTLKSQLDSFFNIDNFRRFVVSLVGEDATVQASLSDLLAESRLRYSLFVREQSTRPVTPSRPARTSESMAVDTGNTDIAFLLRRIEQLELNQRGTSGRGNRRASGPSSGNAERRGRSPRRQPSGRSVSPSHRGRSASRPRPIQQEQYRSQRELSNSQRRRDHNQSSNQNRSSGSRSPSRSRPPSPSRQRNRPPTPRGGHGRGNPSRNRDNRHHQRRQY